MDKYGFKRIQVRVRFLKRACNGHGIHPFDVEDTCLMREDLAALTISDLACEKLNFVEVAQAITELDSLLGVMEIGMEIYA